MQIKRLFKSDHHGDFNSLAFCDKIILMENKQTGTIILASKNHIELILEEMKLLKNEFSHSFFVASTPEELDFVINKGNGFILLNMIEDKLGGGVIVIYPNSQMHYLSNHPFSSCAIIDSIFLNPSFRKRGIASTLLEIAISKIVDRRFIYASVALDNTSSQNLFFRHGFKTFEQKKLYNDYPRLVLLLEKSN